MVVSLLFLGGEEGRSIIIRWFTENLVGVGRGVADVTSACYEGAKSAMNMFSVLVTRSEI